MYWNVVILICVCIKSNVITLELLEYSWVYFDKYWCMGPSGHFYSCVCLVIRDAQIFRRLTGSQRTPRFWGVTEVSS